MEKDKPADISINIWSSVMVSPAGQIFYENWPTDKKSTVAIYCSNKDRRAGSDELLRKEKGLNYLRWQKQFRELRRWFFNQHVRQEFGWIIKHGQSCSEKKQKPNKVRRYWFFISLQCQSPVIPEIKRVKRNILSHFFCAPYLKFQGNWFQIPFLCYWVLYAI